MELNSRDVVVSFGPTQARAMIGVSELQHVFSMNPDEVKWSYKNNTVSRDTIGGRVVQILSATTESMTVTGRAGSRRELQILSKNLKDIMQYQIKTGGPVHFKVPSRNWDFLVFLQNVSSLGWDVSTTSYPFQLTLMIKDDLTGVADKVIEGLTFDKMSKGIGYNPKFHGGDAASAMRYVESMLGAIDAIDSGAGSSSTAYEDEGSSVTGSCDKISPDCKKFRDEVIRKKYAQLELPGGGICVCKKIKGSDDWSDHSWGAAIDCGNSSSSATAMQSLADFAVKNHVDYKVKYVIHNYHIWSATDDWKQRRYDGVDPHVTHVHVSFLDSGAGDGASPPGC